MNLEDTDQSASAWLQEQLAKPNNPDASKLLIEELTTRLKGEPLHKLPSFQAALFQSLLAQRQADYNASVRADWDRVYARYKQSGEFFFDLPTCRVYPVALDPVTEQPDSRFATKPSSELAVAISYDVAEEANALETQEQLNRDNPYSTWTIGHLRRTRWSLNVYGGVPEPLYNGFQGVVDGWMQEFKRKHGSVTPILDVPQSRILLHVGADQIFVGFRIEQKNPAASDETPKRKLSGILGKLSNIS